MSEWCDRESLGRRGGRTFKLPLTVRVSAKIVRTSGNVHAVSRIRLHGNALLGISPSPALASRGDSVAARGWIDHLLLA